MDAGSEKIVEFILAKNEGTITDEDRAFLLARRSYVPDKEFERLGITLPGSENSNPEGRPAGGTGAPEKKLAQMNKAELLMVANAKGIIVPDGATNDQIRELIG